MVDMADRLSVAFGAEALDFIKGEFRAGGNDEIVVIDKCAVAHPHALRGGLDLLCLAHNQLDPALLHGGNKVNNDVFPIPPTYQNPWI